MCFFADIVCIMDSDPSLSTAPALPQADPLPSQAELVAGLRERLGAVGFSMARLCARAGVSHTTPARWESGATSLRWDLYQKLHSALLEIEADFNAANGSTSCGKLSDFAPVRVASEGAGAVQC